MSLDWATGPLIVGWLFVLVWVPLVVLSNRKAHPKALFILFFAELWERFSFYGMRALLTLYMTKVLFEQMEQGEADAKAYGIYGAFNALLYGAPVIGGVLADRMLGFRRAVIMGGIFMALGQFTLAGTIGMEIPFYAGLGLIVVGNGFFKPNISSFLGTFYEQNDPRKDGAFTIFYMGVNIGAFLSPLTCGYLGEKHDWSYGFLAAGIGIVLGVVVFWRSLQPYTDKGTPPDPAALEQPGFLGLKPQMLVVVCSICAVPVIALLLGEDFIVDVILVVAGVLILGYLVITSAKAEDRVQGQRLLVVVVLFFFHMIFWALFEQAGASLTLFTERHVDRFVDPAVPDSGIPASQFQSLNPFYIMVLAPVFSWIWVRLRRMKAEPRTPMKFVLGLAQLAIGYAIIVWGASSFADRAVVPVLFLALMYLFHTTGELSVSPVGLSVVTKLSPPRVVGFVMGTWFLSIAFAHKFASFLGTLAAKPDAGASAEVAMQAFTDVYWFWGVIVVSISAVFLLVLSPLLKRWMHGIH
jgi:POT family proton-dependent oligopeptide transporter